MIHTCVRSPGKPRLLAAALGVYFVSGCSGTANSTSQPSIEAKLSVLEQKVFHPSCSFSSCHGADTPQKGLDLSGATYQVIVNRASREDPTRMLVVPSDPSSSYLFEKISVDQPTSGSRMPYTSSPLPDFAISAVRQWIEQGALDD